MRYLLDTNILIYAGKRQGGCLERMDAHPASTMAWCVVTLQELTLGAAKSVQPARSQAYIGMLRQLYALLDYDAEAAQQAGRLQAVLQRQGTPIGPMDAQIAGIALAHDLTLVTRNLREFERMPGLRVENWYT